jgi:hypothetical protein
MVLSVQRLTVNLQINTRLDLPAVLDGREICCRTKTKGGGGFENRTVRKIRGPCRGEVTGDCIAPYFVIFT